MPLPKLCSGIALITSERQRRLASRQSWHVDGTWERNVRATAACRLCGDAAPAWAAVREAAGSMTACACARPGFDPGPCQWQGGLAHRACQQAVAAGIRTREECAWDWERRDGAAAACARACHRPGFDPGLSQRLSGLGACQRRFVGASASRAAHTLAAPLQPCRRRARSPR